MWNTFQQQFHFPSRTTDLIHYSSRLHRPPLHYIGLLFTRKTRSFPVFLKLSIFRYGFFPCFITTKSLNFPKWLHACQADDKENKTPSTRNRVFFNPDSFFTASVHTRMSRSPAHLFCVLPPSPPPPGFSSKIGSGRWNQKQLLVSLPCTVWYFPAPAKKNLMS